ncbi:hypothetical protein GNI_071200 [Gregarina niphandrodes]|uniref:Uncharacterized protein n=1 Tax=Gregarina niphandrodes TaxID=110365 RepID=A0A023B7C0_GRENI|nr:hypothetical protein GNI_071200 [Gregarina niphandrodes]EZG67156.1 hypothetical protein GNI_071200 [Gregarina niphandrodes]|eukprot:XP_011130325.1 hypothetical protein GNI_071200 [Gregarina niphandrodes]
MRFLTRDAKDISVGAGLLAHVVWPVSFNGDWLDVTELADPEAIWWCNMRGGVFSSILPEGAVNRQGEMDALVSALQILHDLPNARVRPCEEVMCSHNTDHETLRRAQHRATRSLSRNSWARGALLISIASFLHGVKNMFTSNPQSVSKAMQKKIIHWWAKHSPVLVNVNPAGLHCPMPIFPALRGLNVLTHQFDCLFEARLQTDTELERDVVTMPACRDALPETCEEQGEK